MDRPSVDDNIHTLQGQQSMRKFQRSLYGLYVSFLPGYGDFRFYTVRSADLHVRSSLD